MSIDWYRVAVGTRDDVRLVAFMDAYDMARCLARLGSCLAQAGAMQAMYEAGKAEAYACMNCDGCAEGGAVAHRWSPNVDGLPAPGWKP